MAMSDARFTSFREFYPFYLQEHSNRTCRRLHFIGTSSILTLLLAVVITGNWVWLWAFPVIGYGFAWVGHFVYEKNRPATFKYPLYSFMGDFVMYKDIWLRRLSI
jgi:hypothetical protein